jgi:hypothetical protein
MSLQIVFALSAFATGLRAAWLWEKSTKNRIPSIWDHVEDESLNVTWLKSVRDAFRTASYLNGRAAQWTAWSVFCSAASTLLSAFSSN